VVAVVVEIAAPGSSTWAAVTCQVFGIGWARGASEDRGVLAVPEAGQCTAYLVDPNRDLDPANVASVFAGVIDLGAQLRVTMAGGVAFVGRIDSISHGLSGDRDPLARINATDAAARMAGVTTTTVALPAETSSARIGHLLDAAAVAPLPAQRDLQAGGVDLQAADGLVNDAWSDTLAVIQNELGTIDFRPDGSVVTRTRSTAWTPGAPALHLGCDAGAIELNSLDLISDRTTVRNRVDAARAGGTATVWDDAPSQAKYGLRATSRHDLALADDVAVDAWATFLLARSRLPTRGYENATVVNASAAAVAAIEAVPLFTGRVHLYQDDQGPLIDVVLRLLGVAWDVDGESNATATLILGTDNATALVVRTAVYDTQAQWAARALGGTSGVDGWYVSGDTLRAGSDAPGGLDQVTISWRSLG
jgi:hypothetical protein